LARDAQGFEQNWRGTLVVGADAGTGLEHVGQEAARAFMPR